MINYKQKAIAFLNKNDYLNAKVFFSLAYKKRKNKRLLIFIDLCDLGLKKPLEAAMLAGFYLANYKEANIDKYMDDLILKASLKQVFKGRSFSFQDFCISLEKVGFKQAHESVIFQTKLIINEKEEFFAFMRQLLANNKLDLVLTYLLELNPYFTYNKSYFTFSKLLRKYNEDKNNK